MRNIRDEYFEWLFRLVCGKRYSKRVSYRELLTRLFNTEFRYLILKDRNRAEDGMDLRYRFALSQYRYDSYVQDNIMHIIDGPCNVLEMMIALSIRCEENIMDDPTIGDRTGQWFWGMIVNLGLGSMTDDRFDSYFVDETIDRFLDRQYEPNGKGGLFTINHCDRDLRDVEIWYQLCYYLDTMI